MLSDSLCTHSRMISTTISKRIILLPKALISTPLLTRCPLPPFWCDIINLICWASCLSRHFQLSAWTNEKGGSNLHKAEIKQEVNECEKGVNVQVFLIDILRFIRFQQRMIITQFLIVGTFVLLIAVSIYPLCCNFFSCRNSQLSLAHPRFFPFFLYFNPFLSVANGYVSDGMIFHDELLLLVVLPNKYLLTLALLEFVCELEFILAFFSKI